MSQLTKTRREQVVELLEQFVRVGIAASQKALGDFTAQVGTKAYFQILDDIIAHSKGPVRILACQLVMTSDNRPIPQRQALQTLRELAEQGPEFERILAINYLLKTRNISKELVPSMISLRDSLKEGQSRVLIAAAIYQALDWNDKGELEVLWHEAVNQLLAAFDSKQPLDRLIAAEALQHVELHKAQIRQSILESCQSAKGLDRVMLLSYLAKLAGTEKEIVSALISFALKESDDAEERIAAIQSMTHLPAEQSDVDEVLTTLAQSQNWNIALAAITCLTARRGSLPKPVVERLTANISHPSPDVRCLSAGFLADHFETAEEFYPHLVHQLAMEDTQQAGEAILKALGRGGQAALSAVVAAMEQVEPHQLSIFQSAMLEFAEHAVHEVAQLLTASDGRVRGSAVGVLQTRGPLAKPIVPFLSGLLESEDRETVQNALILLSSIGPASLDCFEKLVALLQSSDQDMRVLAQGVFWKIGPVCVAPLRKARRKFPEWERDTIDECLRLLAHSYESEDLLLAGVDGVTDENDLELFCLVAEMLLERGPLSFRELSKLLQQPQGKAIRDELPCSEGQIRLTIQRLEKAWGTFWGIPIRLLDRSGTSKGGLSEEMGHRYLRQSQKYLERLRIVRGK